MAENREIRFTFAANTKQLDKAFDLEKAKLNQLKATSKEQAKQEMENALQTLKNSKLKGKAYDDELIKIRRAYREKVNQLNYASEVERALLKSEKREKAEQLKEQTRLERQALREQEQAQKEKIQNIKKLLSKFNINISDEQASQLQDIGAMAGKLAIVVAIVSKLNKAYKNVTKTLRDVSAKVRTMLYKAIEKSIQGMIALFSSLYNLLTQLVEKLYELAKYGGDLQAANNMVAASFGDMTDELNGFCNVAKETYGLTETMAKKTAGLFMSMSNSMGIARSEGEKMAISLAALSGDMASFYNAKQSDIMLALKSVYTGETETLKNYAIVLTEANLKQYMLEKGITSSYQEMNQAEKTLLRYAYVMETTSAVQGNFARTGDNYITTLATIKAEVGKLLEVLGKVAIQLLTPMLKVLSVIIAKLQVMAQVLSECLETMFGLGAVSGVLSGDTSLIDWESEEDAADKTIESIKSKISTLSGVDTINTLQEPNSSSSANGAVSSYEKLKEIIESLHNYQTGSLIEIDKSQFAWVKKVMSWIKKRVTNLKKSFSEAFGNIDLSNLQSAFNNFSKSAGPFIDWLIEKFAVISAWFSSKILPHLLNISSVLMEIIPLIVEAIDWNTISKMIEDLLVFIAVKLKEFKTWCEENPEQLSNIVNIILQIVLAIGFILPILLTVGDAILTIISYFGTLMTFVAGPLCAVIGSSLGNLFGTYLREKILEFINVAKQYINTFVTELQIAFSKFASFIENIFNNIPNLILAGVNAAIKMVNSLINSINNLKFEIPDWVPEIGGKSFGLSMPNIPQLQNGGVLSQPNITQASGSRRNSTSSHSSTSSDSNNGYFEQMISLLQGIYDKDTNTYLDGKAITKSVTKNINNESWRRNLTQLN